MKNAVTLSASYRYYAPYIPEQASDGARYQKPHAPNLYCESTEFGVHY